MKDFYLKHAAYQAGFEARITQLVQREMAQQQMEKESQTLAKLVGYGVRGLRNLPGATQRGAGALGRGMRSAVQGVKNYGTGIGASFREGAGLELTPAQKLWKTRGQAPVNAKPPGWGGGTGRVNLEQAQVLRDPNFLRPNAAPSWSSTGAATGGAAPNWTSGTVGQGAAGAGGAAAQQAAAAPAAAASGGAAEAGAGAGILGNIGKHWQTLWNKVPAGPRGWMERNPMLTGIGLGGGAYAAGDMYGEARRRDAIRNLGAMQRLGLAGQLLFSPEGAIESMRL